MDFTNNCLILNKQTLKTLLVKKLYILILSLIMLSCTKDDVEDSVAKNYKITYDVFTADEEEDRRYISMQVRYTDEHGEQILISTTDPTWSKSIEFKSFPGKNLKLDVLTSSPYYLIEQNRAPDPVMTRVSIYVNDALKAEQEYLTGSRVSYTLE